MRNRDEKKELAIYHAAMELVMTEGLAHSSMSKIARKAGVSPSTLYVYFENKQDMLNKLYLRAKEESSIALLQGVDLSMDFRGLLAAYIRGMFEFMQQNPVMFSFMEQFHHSPSIEQEVKDAGLRYYAPYFEAYEKAVRDGVLRNLPVQLVSAILIEPIKGLVQSHLTGEVKVTEELLESFIDVVWTGMKA